MKITYLTKSLAFNKLYLCFLIIKNYSNDSSITYITFGLLEWPSEPESNELECLLNLDKINLVI